MLVALYTLIALVAYLTIGWALAVWNLPRAWRVARAKWRSKAYIRESVQSQSVAMVLSWPFYGTFLLISRRNNPSFHRADD